MKKIIKLRRRKRPVIAILYHYVSDEIKEKYFSDEHTLVDNQTDEVVNYVKNLLRKRKYRIQVINVKPDDLSSLQKIKADFVFNLVDSKAMELKIAKILGRMNIPHSGSAFKAIQASNNKIKTKKIFMKNNIPTPKFTIIKPSDRITRSILPSKFPVIIKPAYEHCSIGITDLSVAVNYKQFKSIVQRLRKKYGQTLIAEEFIEGKELQVTVLETPNETHALPIAEIIFNKDSPSRWNIYGFDEKWNKNLAVYKSYKFVAPPRHVRNALEKNIKRDAIKAFYAMNFRDYARFDLRFNIKNKNWFFLEGNANCGFDADPNDATNRSIAAAGMTMDDFLLQIVRNSVN